MGQKSFIFDARLPCWIAKCGYLLKKKVNWKIVKKEKKIENFKKRKENWKKKNVFSKKEMKQKIEIWKNLRITLAKCNNNTKSLTLKLA